MGMLLVTVQVRLVEFPTTALVRVTVTSTSGGTALERLSDKIFITVIQLTRENNVWWSSITYSGFILPGFRDYLGKSAWFQKLAYINMYKLLPDSQTAQHSVQWTGFPVPPVPKLEKKNSLDNAGANQITFMRLCTIFGGFNDRINFNTVAHCTSIVQQWRGLKM